MEFNEALAQSVEQLPFKQRVTGSNPVRLTNFLPVIVATARLRTMLQKRDFYLSLLLSLGFVFANIRAVQGESTMESREKATFAGGCFWCMEPAFDAISGVVSTTVGYTGGSEKIQPTSRSRRARQATWKRSKLCSIQRK